jgi:hypothetical protein
MTLGDFSSANSPIGSSARSSPSPAISGASAGWAAIKRLPARRLIELGEHHRRLLAERIDKIRIELRAAPISGDHDRRFGAAGAAEYLDHVREVDQPRADRDLLALHAVCAFAIPALVGLSKALTHMLAEPEPLGKLVGRAVVVLRQRPQRTQPVAQERDSGTSACSRARSRPPRCCRMNKRPGPTLPMA